MVNRNLIRNLESDQEVDTLFQSAVAEIEDPDDMISLFETGQDFSVNNIVDGRVVRVDEESVLIDVGLKSEGTVPLVERDDNEDPPGVGQTIKCLIEEVEEEIKRLKAKTGG